MFQEGKWKFGHNFFFLRPEGLLLYIWPFCFYFILRFDEGRGNTSLSCVLWPTGSVHLLLLPLFLINTGMPIKKSIIRFFEYKQFFISEVCSQWEKWPKVAS